MSPCPILNTDGTAAVAAVSAFESAIRARSAAGSVSVSVSVTVSGPVVSAE